MIGKMIKKFEKKLNSEWIEIHELPVGVYRIIDCEHEKEYIYYPSKDGYQLEEIP